MAPPGGGVRIQAGGAQALAQRTGHVLGACVDGVQRHGPEDRQAEGAPDLLHGVEDTGADAGVLAAHAVDRGQRHRHERHPQFA
ncbi:hypothetical protein [Nocardioides sp. cx-169]|uniref:hypothetical protein n=1 Tax=Nocardioides sp. cx-169 TaxID=2899080 RepID=UPI001E5FA5E8|nr:hypothetical protein [Nocardioides sp. cx-169]